MNSASGAPSDRTEGLAFRLLSACLPTVPWAEGDPMRSIGWAVIGLMLALASGGCAAVGLAVIGTALGVGAGQGTAYTLDGIAYRTFTASLADTRRATLTTLRRMDMALESDTTVPNGDSKVERRDLVALAGDRKVYIELEKLTTRTTRMRVTAKQGWFWRDRATAGEVIAQTADALEDSPTVSQKGR